MNVGTMSSTNYIQNVFTEAKKLNQLVSEAKQAQPKDNKPTHWNPEIWNKDIGRSANELTAYIRNNLRNQPLTPEHLRAANELQPKIQQHIDGLQSHSQKLQSQIQPLKSSIENSRTDYANLIAANNFDDAAILEKKNQDTIKDIDSLERQIQGFTDAITLISPDIAVAERIVDSCKLSLLDQAYREKQQNFDTVFKEFKTLYDECNSLHYSTNNAKFGMNKNTDNIQKMLNDDSFFYQQRNSFIDGILGTNQT